MKLELKQPYSVRGSSRTPLLSIESVEHLSKVEKEIGALIYTDMWWDATDTLTAKRLKKSNALPGYSGHNFGLSVILNLKAIFLEKQIDYNRLIKSMATNGWFCQRRDNFDLEVDSAQFNYLGPLADKYLAKCTMNPETWDSVIDHRIYDLYGKDFQLSLEDIQEKLFSLGMYNGEITSQLDLYTREAIMAFQRAYNLPQKGHTDYTLCRALTFATAEIKIV